MKLGTIKLTLRRKVKNWLDSISDEALRSSLADNVMVCGGAIASFLQNKSANDYDLYFKTYDAALKVAHHYVNRFNSENRLDSCNEYTPEVTEKSVVNINNETERRILCRVQSAGVASVEQNTYKYIENQLDTEGTDFVDSLNKTIDEVVEVAKSKTDEYAPIFLTDNAISLKGRVQIIIRFHGDKEEIFKNFDFVHACCCYDYAKDELFIHPKAMESLLTNRLIYQGSLYPICSFFRIRKFLYRDWRISAGQMLKIVYQISKIDFSNIEQMKEQLIGVDSAYMYDLLRELESAKAKNIRIDQLYIAELCDRLFE